MSFASQPIRAPRAPLREKQLAKIERECIFCLCQRGVDKQKIRLRHFVAFLSASDRLKEDLLSYPSSALSWTGLEDTSSCYQALRVATKELELVKESLEDDRLSFALSNDALSSLSDLGCEVAGIQGDQAQFN